MLIAAEPGVGDGFGSRIAISGGEWVVAAPNDCMSGNGDGAVLRNADARETDAVIVIDPSGVLRDGQRDVLVGYDIAEWLRTNHPLGRMLPIIYLSGRESAQGFIARMRQNGQYHPGDFITKAEIGIDVEILLGRIAHFDSELARLYALIEEHGPERGRYIFHDMFYE